jgi:hypothetical protein
MLQFVLKRSKKTPARKVKIDIPLPQVCIIEESNNEYEDDECLSVTVMTEAEILSRQSKWGPP